MPNTEETEQPSTLQSTLIGNLILADELCFAQDEKEETADGYLIATDALVQRLLQFVEKQHTQVELHKFGAGYPRLQSWEECTFAPFRIEHLFAF